MIRAYDDYGNIVDDYEQKIRSEAIDEFIELYEKFCNDDTACDAAQCTNATSCARCFRDNYMEQLNPQDGTK